MKRRKYTAEQKVKILREHFEKNISVPDICEEFRIHPNQFLTSFLNLKSVSKTVMRS